MKYEKGNSTISTVKRGKGDNHSPWKVPRTLNYPRRCFQTFCIK